MLQNLIIAMTNRKITKAELQQAIAHYKWRMRIVQGLNTTLDSPLPAEQKRRVRRILNSIVWADYNI